MFNPDSEPSNQPKDNVEKGAEIFSGEEIEITAPGAETNNPQEKGRQDKKELDKFMRSAESDALLQILEGKDPNALLKIVERHDKEFAPQKMTEIEKDAKECVEKMPDVLRNIINNPDALKQLTESFAGAEEQDVRHKLETILMGIEKDPELKQWIEDQYVIKRIRSFISPEKPQKQEEEFSKEEQSKIQSRISKEVGKAVEKIEKGDFYELSNKLYKPAKGFMPERRIREIYLEIKRRIEAGEKIEIFKNTDEDFRRVFEKLQDKAEKEERMENPYREIERRLISAQKKLKKEGLAEDAENLTKTIARVQRDISSGKSPGEILLWDKEVDLHPRKELSGVLKWFDKIDKAMLKIPLIGRHMARDYKEPVRDAGGTIIGADGSQDKFFTFTRFKKSGEKTHTNAFFGGDYDYVIEPGQGDEVVSWEPSDQGKQIIMEALGGSAPSLPGARSMGQTKIEYWKDEFFTDNVEFDVKKREDVETGQIYSNARLILKSAPRKK